MKQSTIDHANRRDFMLGGVAAAGVAGLVAAQFARGDVSNDCHDDHVVPTVFDVTAYGATAWRTPNWDWGVADSAPAFQAAIAAAKAAGGGLIFVPRGFYTVHSSILIDADNIRLVGEGRGITYIAGINVSGAIISFNQSAASAQITHCSVEELTLYGSSVPLAADQAIALYNAAKITLRGIEFRSNLKTTTGNSLLYIVNSWIVHGYDLHFSGIAPYASLRIHRTSTSETSNALYFFGCNFYAQGTPNAVVIESDTDITGEVYAFTGITCQGYDTGIWVKRGQDIGIQNFYGEENGVDIRLGDSASSASYVRGVTIENWRTFNSDTGIHLEQCALVKIGIGTPRNTARPVLVGRATGVFLFARHAGGDQDAPTQTQSLVSFDATAANGRAGIMIFDGDTHDAPDWPCPVNPMGIILKSAADDGRHYKIFVDASGQVATKEYQIDNSYLKPTPDVPATQACPP